MPLYSVAGLVLDTDHDRPSHFEQYRVPDSRHPCVDITHRVHFVDALRPQGDRLFSSNVADAFVEGGEHRTYYREEEYGDYYVYNTVTDDGSRIDSYFQTGTAPTLYALAYEFGTILLRHGGMLLHAAAVEFDGRAFLLTAPAGVGKTTLARHWRDTLRAFVLNGDSPAIRRVDGRVSVCGVPWCGASGESIDRVTPLAGVLLLRQGPRNRLTACTLPDLLPELYSQMMFCQWRGELRPTAMTVLGDLLCDVPLWTYECVNDPSAALYAREVLCER